METLASPSVSYSFVNIHQTISTIAFFQILDKCLRYIIVIKLLDMLNAIMDHCLSINLIIKHQSDFLRQINWRTVF